MLQFLEHDAIGEPELQLSGCDILVNLNGKTFATLSTFEKLKIKRTPIRAIIINKSGDSFVKYEMFKRLNTGGSLLSAQEIRNCSSRMVEGGDMFYEAIQNMASHPQFVNAIARLPESSKEQRADEELVLRYFEVTKFREGFKGNIEDWLDSFMEGVLFNDVKFDISASEQKFQKVFSLIAEKLADQAFTRFNDYGKATGRLAPAYFEAVVAVFDEECDKLTDIPADEMLQRLIKAFSSIEFKDATGPGANTIPKLQKRIDVVKCYLVV
mgnify:FL=1